MTEFFVRSYPLEDITITKGGDGRTVEAYAAVFNRSAEIRDQDGHYLEEIDPSAFNRTISNRRNRFGVFYNHGLTIHGTPSDRGSVPIGTPVEVRVDNVGVRTVTRYNRTALAEEVLESINSGAITAQSFTGRFMRSNPARVPRGTKAGKLPSVTRMEIDMREYGPTPFPAYAEAMITGVRASFAGLVPEQGGSLWSRLTTGADLDLILKDPAMAEEFQRFLARRAEATDEEFQDLLTRVSVDLSATRGTVPTDELTSSRGEDTPERDSSHPGTPPKSDPPAGDPAPDGGHSARLRVARAVRKMKLEAMSHGGTQTVGGS
jgi:HK97 family phage prohead protease